MIEKSPIMDKKVKEYKSIDDFFKQLDENEEKEGKEEEEEKDENTKKLEMINFLKQKENDSILFLI